jgi:hypothetical protein
MTDAPGRFTGLSVPEPEFADDDGSADPALTAVLAAYAQGRAADHDVVALLAGARLMAPLVAVLDSVYPDGEAAADHDDPDDHDACAHVGHAAEPVRDTGAGLRREKDSHMATVSLVADDGRSGLLAFTCVASMAGWDPDARGIPASAQRVAQAALEDGNDAVVLDLGGPVRFALTGQALAAVAHGTPWLPAYADARLLAAVAEALVAVAGVHAHEVTPAPPGHGADLLVLLAVTTGEEERVATEAAGALATHPVLVQGCPGGLAVGLLG